MSSQVKEREVLRFLPDLSFQWTLTEAQETMPDFKFAGPGVYKDGTDLLFVVPLERTFEGLWSNTAKENEKFLFYIFSNCKFFDTVYSRLGEMPVRVLQVKR